MLMRRPLRALLLFAITSATLAGCLATHPQTLVAAEPTIRPEVFFRDTTHGDGVLRIRASASKAVRVTSVGATLPDGSFRLEQEIALGDDPVRTRTWVMRSTGPTTYTGTLTDATGPVEVRLTGNTMSVYYKMGSFMSMHQRLELQPGRRTVMNYSTVRVLGIPVARLNETITRDTPIGD